MQVRHVRVTGRQGRPQTRVEPLPVQPLCRIGFLVGGRELLDHLREEAPKLGHGIEYAASRNARSSEIGDISQDLEWPQTVRLDCSNTN